MPQKRTLEILRREIKMQKKMSPKLHYYGNEIILPKKAALARLITINQNQLRLIGIDCERL